MIYVFEDNENDAISKFFCQAYPDEISSKFIYANGNGNIEKKVDNVLSDTKELITVFIDMVPGNDSARGIYNNLKYKSRKSNFRIIILPIVCSEYYLLQYLYKSKLIEDYTGVEIALGKQMYNKSPLIKTEDDIRFCTNFEKYCKLVVKKCPFDCAKKPSICNKRYGMFYREDCKCEYNMQRCVDDIRKIDKSVTFIKEYPCFPYGGYASDVTTLTVENVWHIHRRLVNEFNETVDTYISNDSIRKAKYKYIKVIK